MRIHHQNLKKKGWSDAEINDAKKIIERAEAAKHPAYSFLEIAVFWGLLFITIVGSFIVSVVILPLLLVLPDTIIAVLLIIFGIVFGSLFAFAVSDVEWLERKHHLSALIGLALMSIINIILVDSHTSRLTGEAHHTFLLAIIFAIMLITPYAFHIFEREVHQWK